MNLCWDILLDYYYKAKDLQHTAQNNEMNSLRKLPRMLGSPIQLWYEARQETQESKYNYVDWVLQFTWCNRYWTEGHSKESWSYVLYFEYTHRVMVAALSEWWVTFLNLPTMEGHFLLFWMVGLLSIYKFSMNTLPNRLLCLWTVKNIRGLSFRGLV